MPTPTEHEYWMLSGGSYTLVFAAYYHSADGQMQLVKCAEVKCEVNSAGEAKYLFGRITDLARRVKRMAKLSTISLLPPDRE